MIIVIIRKETFAVFLHLTGFCDDMSSRFLTIWYNISRRILAIAIPSVGGNSHKIPGPELVNLRMTRLWADP